MSGDKVPVVAASARVELIAGAHAGRGELGEPYVFHDVPDAALQALAPGGDRRALHRAISKDRDVDRNRTRDPAPFGFADDAPAVHLIEMAIELGNDLVAAQLLFATLLRGIPNGHPSPQRATRLARWEPGCAVGRQASGW